MFCHWPDLALRITRDSVLYKGDAFRRSISSTDATLDRLQKEYEQGLHKDKYVAAYCDIVVYRGDVIEGPLEGVPEMYRKYIGWCISRVLDPQHKERPIFTA